MSYSEEIESYSELIVSYTDIISSYSEIIESYSEEIESCFFLFYPPNPPLKKKEGCATLHGFWGKGKG